MAQTETASSVPVPLSVQRLAPQLVTFAGSETNFQSLVNGLANGTPVQLTTTLSNGFSQTVTFTPSSLGSPAQIAQILEAARQQLIGLGIGAPTAEQIGFTLMGGVVPTPLGGTQVGGLANAQATTTAPSRAAQIQQQAGAGATAATPAVTSAVNVQTTPTAATTTTTTVTAPRQTSDSLISPGATSRSTAPVVGASPVFNTSASPAVNTSTSPIATTPNPAPGAGSAIPSGTERVPANARPARN
ncbi:MAG TPA: hypothetical protein VFZ54_13700 [Burkholderiales bacterium]